MVIRVTIHWTAAFRDPLVCGWHVYASDQPDWKGRLIAAVPADETSVEVSLEPGVYYIRVVAYLKGCVEEPWEQVRVQEIAVTGREFIPPTPTEFGVLQVGQEGYGRVVWEPPSRGSCDHRMQLIEGVSAAQGKLLSEFEALPDGPFAPERARQVTVAVPLAGPSMATRVLHLRGVTPGGQPGTAASRTIVGPGRPDQHEEVIASVVGTTRVNFPAAASTDPFEYDATDGIRLKATPAWDDPGAWSGWGNWDTGLLAQHYLAPYLQSAVIESDEIDLGSEMTFILDCYDALQRKSVAGAWTSRPFSDLSLFHWRPETDRQLEQDNTYSPAWLFRDVLWDTGAPRQPIRSWRWQYVIGTSPSVPHASGDYIPLVPGGWVTGRYLRVRLRVADLTGWHQVICPRIKVVAWMPRLFVTGTGSPESVVVAPPGSKYVDTGGSVVYVKATGTGNTGWVST